jgi:hypothetical protein
LKPVYRKTLYFVDGFGDFVLSGNFLNISAIWLIGAANMPIALLKYGFSPALGCDFDGTNAFVKLNFLAIFSDSLFIPFRASSSAGRSLFLLLFNMLRQYPL